jgi:superfamily II DNA or RNA helicase
MATALLEPRRFGVNQRAALFLAAGGRCSRCGSGLLPGWHADHVEPWAHGGPTDVINGQALCPACNLRKGSRMQGPLSPWPGEPPMRKWADRAFRRYLAHQGKNFLAVATPGAGKTRFALRVAHEELRIGRVSFLFIVAPSEQLKYQWAAEAHKVGIHLSPDFSNGDGIPARDYHGVIVTYAQVAANPEIHRALCRVPTLVIFDEIHHAGDELPWGDSITHAFGPAVRRLLLSGTPFRTDNNRIPFVEYVDGTAAHHFVYGYGEALGDSVCRPVLFPSYEGNMKWYSRGKAFEANFREDLSDERSAQRLRTALDPSGEWLPRVLKDADERLTQIRQDHPDAGGLVVARDKDQAAAIARMLTPISGEAPLVVTCDDADAKGLIDGFKTDRRRWVVAIKLISEGADVPRLRVGIYASNILTEMFFRQVVGRFVRMMTGIEDQNAYLFIPADPTLISFAMQIKEERDHQLEEECREARQAPSEDEPPAHDDKTLSLFVAISSTGHPDAVIVDEDAIPQSEILEADEIRRKHGAPPSYDPALLARMFRSLRRPTEVTVRAETHAPAAPPSTPLHEQKKDLRKIVKRLVAMLREASSGDLEFSDIYTALLKRDGVPQDQATIDQLKGRVEYLENWIRSITHGG